MDVVVLASDTCDPDPAVVLSSLTSSEPDNATGDGDTANGLVEIVVPHDQGDLKSAKASKSAKAAAKAAQKAAKAAAKAAARSH
jgi:hypothetical protein